MIKKWVLNGTEFQFYESKQIDELVGAIFGDSYKIGERELRFAPGDVVLDIGANEGVFSIMLAKLFPQIRVVSLEPVQRTFMQLIRNISLNNVTNVEPHMFGVGDKAGKRRLIVSKDTSGGSSGVMTEFNPDHHDYVDVSVMPLDDILKVIGKVKLLKIDIEGMEYEALYASKLLSNVGCLVGEFHMNTALQQKGYDINELATWVGEKTDLIFYQRCRMAE